MRRTRIEEHAPSAKRHGRETNGPAATGGREDGNEESTGSRPRSGTPEKRSLAGPSRVRRFQTIKLVRRDVGRPSQRRRSVAGLAETSIRGPRSTTRNHRRRRHVWANTYFRVSNTDVNSVLHGSATRENEESEDEKTVALYVEFRSLEAPTLGARSESQRSSADGSQQSAFGGQDRHIRRGSFVQHVVCRLRRLGQQVVEDVRGVGIAPVVVPVEGRASSSGRT